MSKDVTIRLCDRHAKTCVLEIRKVDGSLQDAKCATCKKLNPTYLYEVRTKADSKRGGVEVNA